jgi:hypothetical protein
MESDCHIAHHSRLIDSSLFDKQISAEISKTKRIAGKIIFLLARQHADCILVYNVARAVDKADVSQRLKITSYFAALKL